MMWDIAPNRGIQTSQVTPDQILTELWMWFKHDTINIRQDIDMPHPCPQNWILS